ncbi:MAG TPA: chemotaxis protein CheW, partial [bacterium]|nr:chemotaxis protein CheW [bacterium]
MSGKGTDRNRDDDTILTFRVGEAGFCTSALAVESIEEVPAVTSLPLTPPAVEGVFLYKDSVATAVCMARRLGLETTPSQSSSCFIVTTIADHYVAFRVDEVRALISASEVTWDTADPFMKSPFTRFIIWEERVYIYVDLHLLYTLPEGETIQYLQPTLAYGSKRALPARRTSADILAGDQDELVVVNPVAGQPAEIVPGQEDLYVQFDTGEIPESTEPFTRETRRRPTTTGESVRSNDRADLSMEDKGNRARSGGASTVSPYVRNQPSFPPGNIARKSRVRSGITVNKRQKTPPARFRTFLVVSGILLGLLLPVYMIITLSTPDSGYTIRDHEPDQQDNEVTKKRASRKYAGTGMTFPGKRGQTDRDAPGSNRKSGEMTPGSGSTVDPLKSQADNDEREANTITGGLRSG